jgi:hypothetical protein
MSPRDTFWFLAGALTGLAVTLIIRTWARNPQRTSAQVHSSVNPERHNAQEPSTDAQAATAVPSTSSATSASPSAAQPPVRNAIAVAVPVAAALALIAIALGIYFLIGSPDSIAATQASASSRPSPHPVSATSQSDSNAGSLDEVTRGLAARLAANGGSDDDWRLLAQSYEYMGRTDAAEAARKHIATVSGPGAGPGTDATPASGAAPTQDLIRAAADMANSTDGASAAGASASATAAAGLARISGKITLAPALAARAGTNPVLFVYAKQPNVPGPPLAVRRLRVDHWPVSFDLDDTNSMVPGRSLSGAASVELEARISLSGEALPRPGDLIGHLASVDTHHASNLTVVIDHEFGH